MDQKITTVRLTPRLRAGLASLSEVLGRPMNKLINEAVEAYLDHQVKKAEADLGSTLARLRAYRHGDPDYEKAFAAFVKAELENEDPLEGKPVRRGSKSSAAPRRNAAQRASVPAAHSPSKTSKKSGPLSATIDGILGGRLGRK